VNDEVLALVVNDMGGHGRALEILEEELEKVSGSLDNIAELMEKVQQSLFLRYFGWINVDFIPVLRVILVGYKCNSTQDKIPHSKYSVDEICSFGLIHFDVWNRTLICPFILLWMLGSQPTSDLRALLTTNGQLAAQLLGLPTYGPFWQEWEVFNALFRCLKSVVYDGAIIWFNEFHHMVFPVGFKDFKVKVTRLELVQASQQYDTKSTARASIVHELGHISGQSYNHFIINDYAASGGDGWCVLDCLDKEERNEVHQYKLTPTMKLENERVKATAEKDILLLFSNSCSPPSMPLPANTAIVSTKNYKEYYGPFAGRAFFLANITAPNANKATRTRLKLVSGIGEAYANLIVENRPFKGIEDCLLKTKIPYNILQKLSWSE